MRLGFPQEFVAISDSIVHSYLSSNILGVQVLYFVPDSQGLQLR